MLLDVSYEDDSHYDYMSYLAYKLDNKNHKYQVAAFINGTSQDAPAAVPQFAYEAILKMALEDPNFEFKLRSTPQPIPQIVRNRG